MRGTGRILMGWIVEGRMGVVSMARYLGGGDVGMVFLKIVTRRVVLSERSVPSLTIGKL